MPFPIGFNRANTCRTANPEAVGQAAGPSLTRRQLIEHWDNWAAGAESEYRNTAVRRMKAYLNRGIVHHIAHRGEPANRLDLSHLRLGSLPEHLPPGVQILSLRSCRLTEFPASLPNTVEYLNLDLNLLTHLPEQLPNSLRRLHVASNHLTYLPNMVHSNLTELNVSANQLTALPANLPPTLIELNVGGNQLRSLPATLPDNLEILRAISNRVTDLPTRLPRQLRSLDLMGNLLFDVNPNTLTRLTEPCWVDLQLNPLSDESIQRLIAMLNTPGAPGIRVSFDRPHAYSHTQPGTQASAAHTLGQAASAWAMRPQANIDATAQLWQSFAHEPGAAAFSQFLDRLRGTVNFGNKKFKARVAEWLAHIQNNPSLRRDTFLLSEGATTNCEDRVSLTLNAMRQLRLAYDVASGNYDQRLPELLTLARGMFRLDQLEIIAREKAASLNLVDEVEVYLAYQVKLREPLALPLHTADMRYFNVSYVTQTDLNQAQSRVLAAEQSDFSAYLASEWQPWQSVLKRLAPQQHAQAQEELIEAMGGEFTQRLQTRLQANGLTNDPDAERTIGAQVRAEIAREINDRLTHNFLTSHRLLR